MSFTTSMIISLVSVAFIAGLLASWCGIRATWLVGWLVGGWLVDWFVRSTQLEKSSIQIGAESARITSSTTTTIQHGSSGTSSTHAVKIQKSDATTQTLKPDGDDTESDETESENRDPQSAGTPTESGSTVSSDTTVTSPELYDEIRMGLVGKADSDSLVLYQKIADDLEG